VSLSACPIQCTEEPDAVFDWIRSELAAGRNPGLIQQDEKGKEQEDADP